MWTGRRFTLLRELLTVVGSLRPKEDVQYIPRGSTVEVVSEPHSEDPRFVDVRWNEGIYAAFIVDLEERGEEIRASKSRSHGV